MILAEAILAGGSRPLRLFDTFKGLPPPERGDVETEGNYACPLEDVKEFLKEYRFITYHPGIVPFSFKGVPSPQIALAHLDMDLGRPTRDAIQYIWPKITRGGSIVFDDWNWAKCPGVTRAVKENFLPWQVEETGAMQCRVTKE